MSLLKQVKELHAIMVRKTGSQPDIVWVGNSFTIYNADGSVQRTYKPTATGEKMHNDLSFVRYAIGCYGSAKSTFCMADLVKRACEMPKCKDGVRRFRAVCVRNSMPDLKASTIKTWDYWFGGLGLVKVHKDSPYYYEYIFSDPNGMIEMEVYFLSGDEHPKKLDKFLSTEFTMAYLNEASALPKVLFERLIGRVGGRYPPKDSFPENAPKYFRGIVIDTNPPKMRHWLYDMFEIDKPDGFKMFKTPPGLLRDAEGTNGYRLNPDADNLENLSDPESYYMNMTMTGNEEFIKVAALGEYGQIREGQPIYAEYNDDIHSVDSIEIDFNEPLYLGWDFGLTPTCLVTQFVNGQLRAIQEFVTPFNTSVEELAESRVLPWLNSLADDNGYARNSLEIFSVYDPSDPKGSAVKISPSMVLNQLGFNARPSPTNLIQPRIDAVKFFLNKLVGGKPAFILAKHNCQILREGFINEYRFRKINTMAGEKLEEKPDKTHPYSDIHDSCQYVSLICHGEYYCTKNDLDVDSLIKERINIFR